MKRIGLVLVLASAPGWGQALKMDQLDRLAAKASETVNISLDSSLLAMASGLLSQEDSSSTDLKKLVNGIKQIAIRSFEFTEVGQYNDADVDGIRTQLREPEWKRMVQVRSKKDGDSDIYLRTLEGKPAGLVVIAAEPKELSVISIEGTVSLSDLRRLEGNFGIPKSVTNKEEKKGKEEE